MKVVVQRSKNSSVSVNNNVINKIDFGLVILVGFKKDDSLKNIDLMVKKILNLRIFDDEFGIMNKSVLEVNGSILSISQFTLYADTKKGNRPSYANSLNYNDAKKMYEKFIELLGEKIKVYDGQFGSDMVVNISNDGPVTIMLEN